MLERYFESWARWVHLGKDRFNDSTGQSVLEKLIEQKGQILFSSSGGGSVQHEACIELKIEASLMKLAVTHLDVVHIIRIEYGAKREGNLSNEATQLEKSLYLGIDLRTYKRKLKHGRDHVADTIFKQ